MWIDRFSAWAKRWQSACRGTLFAIGLAILSVRLVVACKPTPPSLPLAIENAAAVEQYEALLEKCRLKGKAEKSYAVYETCADTVDAELCKSYRLRCPFGRMR